METVIRNCLVEYYPNSRGITNVLIREIADMCEENQVDEAGFYEAVKAYRKKDEKYNFVPSARDLEKHIEKRIVVNAKRLESMFINTVINDGWGVAVYTAMQSKLGGSLKQCEAMTQWLLANRIDLATEPYFGFPDWLQTFCRILHLDKDPAAAYSYAGMSAPSGVREFYRKRRELLASMSLEHQRKYFPVLQGSKP